MGNLNSLATVLGLFLKCFVLFLIIFFSTIAGAETTSEIDKLILKSLERIEHRAQVIEKNISTVSERVARLESWKIEQIEKNNRLYSLDLATSNEQIKELSKGLRSVEDKISTFQGMVTTFMVFGSIASFLINIFITIWLSKRKEHTVNIDERTNVIRVRR